MALAILNINWKESFQALTLRFSSCVTGRSVKLWESSAHAAAFHDGRDVCIHVSFPGNSHRRFSQGNPCTPVVSRVGRQVQPSTLAAVCRVQTWEGAAASWFEENLTNVVEWQG